MAVKDGSAAGGQQKPWFRRLRPWPKQVRIAAAGYAVVAIFAIGAGLARAVGASAASALTVGIVAAAPVVVALIGQRITGVKALGVEISLVALSQVQMAGDNSPIAGELADAAMEGAEFGYSNNDALVNQFRSLIEVEPKLLRINLRDDHYWWSTRIFLVAALAQDYTQVEALVFIRSANAQIFVGIASPRVVRERLAAKFPLYESAYRSAQTTTGPIPASDPISIIDAMLTGGAWDAGLGGPGKEKEIREIVASKNIRDWLGRELDTKSVCDGPPTARQQYKIISHDRRYVALTDYWRLNNVVDRDELAVRVATATLER